jgi:hypothetical protein
MNICKKCKSEFQGNYCFNCGHPQVIERINGRYIVSEIGSVLNFQKGFFFHNKRIANKTRSKYKNIYFRRQESTCKTYNVYIFMLIDLCNICSDF